jgi:hypothetical protein
MWTHLAAIIGDLLFTGFSYRDPKRKTIPKDARAVFVVWPPERMAM